MTDYPAPLDALLTLGRPTLEQEDWLDYRARGIGPEHVPDLIRMATEPVPEDAADENPIWYAGIHAWRALGQLGAVEALPALLDLLNETEDDFNDWVTEELPDVFSLMGPAVLPALEEFLRNTDSGVYARTAAAAGLKRLAERHPERREECVRALTDALAVTSSPEVNGFIISDLLTLKAVESAGVIEGAFKAGRVDESIVGDWPDVRYDLGLGPPPPRRLPARPIRFSTGASPRERAADRKARRKREKKARKRNRKRL
jgi:hypothetical protein